MKKVKIDLAENQSIGSVLVDHDEPRKYYPTITVTEKVEGSFPKSGFAHVKFRKVRSETFERDGKEEYRCTLELMEITGLEGGVDKPARSRNEEAGAALDALRDEKMKEEEEY